MQIQYTSHVPELPTTERMFVQRFSATRRAARLARLLVLHQLDEWGIAYGSEPSEIAAAVVAELTANAVLHGRVPGRDFELALTLLGSVLLVEITDTRSDAHPPTQDLTTPAPGDESGRGLLLVAALAVDWGVRMREPSAPGKTVWATIRVRR
ncbi:ATP-binding protein [Streptomyces gobiensis]|uniref:ATP-binding protein n=1 Tax=Streptomyces gobiensis TaxID=2875706 RepID=UPI001E45B61E|nr:ATP-binding protein [Streptomyces gobiensis]UGY90766.1 ATP-binding protein [Streptomyces gobiensis]